jgi:hypothetical protein
VTIRIRTAIVSGLVILAAASVAADIGNPASAQAALLSATAAERSCQPAPRTVGLRLRSRANRVRRLAVQQGRVSRRLRELGNTARATSLARRARRAMSASRNLESHARACLAPARKSQRATGNGSGSDTAAGGGSGPLRVGLVTTYAKNLNEIDWVTDVGAKLMRHEFEHAPDAWDDSFYRRAAQLGITVQPLINTSTVPSTDEAQKAFVAMFTAHVARYGPGGSFWRENPSLNAAFAPQVFEVMNEPYIYWQGGPYNPGAYARLVQRTAEAVRPVNGQVKLAMAAATTYFGPSNDGADWIGALYSAVPNLNDYFDVVAVHPYAGNPDTCNPQFRWCFRQIEVIRSRFVARGAADKRIWITEIGNNTRGSDASTEAEQASYLSRYVEMAKSYGYVDALLYYSYRDFCTNGSDKECWFGVVRPDGTRKPAFDALKRAALAYS